VRWERLLMSQPRIQRLFHDAKASVVATLAGAILHQPPDDPLIQSPLVLLFFQRQNRSRPCAWPRWTKEVITMFGDDSLKGDRLILSVYDYGQEAESYLSSSTTRQTSHLLLSRVPRSHMFSRRQRRLEYCHDCRERLLQPSTPTTTSTSRNR
jgi:hypothetical protein